MAEETLTTEQLMAMESNTVTTEELLADAPIDTPSNVLSWRSARPPSVWERIKEVFPYDSEAESAKAQNALVYSDMLDIPPSQAYEFHDEISKQVKNKTSGQKIVTKKKGIAEAAESGWESSIAGMLLNRKAPAPFESVSQAETWMQGMISMGLDLPFFMAGYGIGGANPISGMAGAFGFTAGLRQVLIDRYTKGETRDAKDLISRIGSAVKETVKGEIVGGFTGGARMMAGPAFKAMAPGLETPAAWTLLNEVATMTAAGKMIEGQLPTAKDFIDTAAVLLTMHIGTRGYETGKARLAEVRNKLKMSYVETGAHPKEILDTVLRESNANPQEDIIDTIERVNQELKSQAPPETVSKAKGEIVQPEPIVSEKEAIIPPGQTPEPQDTGITGTKNVITARIEL